MLLNNAHWTNEHFRERITAKEWWEIVLDERDQIIFHGKYRKLIGKMVRPGVYEVFKKPLQEVS